MSLRKFRDALIVMGAFLAVIWVLQVVNWADGYRLDSEFGILPEHVSRLGEIFTAPFLHFSWQHIEGNSVPLFVLGVLAAYRSIARFLLAHAHRGGDERDGRLAVPVEQRADGGRVRAYLRVLRLRPGARVL